MKLTIKTSELKRALSSVQRVVKEKSGNPAADNVKFLVSDGRLMLTGTNIESFISDSAPLVAVEGEFSQPFLVNPKYVSDLLKEYKGEQVSFSLEEGNTLKLTFDGGEYNLNFFDSKEFPEARTKDEMYSLTVNASSLLSALSQVLAASGDSSGVRPVIDSVLFDIKMDGLTLVGTDMNQMVIREVDSCGSLIEEEAQAVLYNKAAAYLRGCIPSKPEGTATIRYGGHTISIEYGTICFRSTLIDAKYPKYAAVVPADNDVNVIFQRDCLLNIVRRVAICSDSERKFVNLELQAGKLTVASKNVGRKMSAKETLKCSYDGETMKVSLNAERLISMVDEMPGNDALFKFNKNPKKAVIIVPSGEGINCTGLLMPVVV